MAARTKTDVRRLTTLLLVLPALLHIGYTDEVTWSRCWSHAAYRGRATRGRDDSATTLNLIGCRIKELELDCFKETRNLEAINLDGNQLEQIDNAVFRHVTNITELNIANNNLKHVPVCVANSLELPQLKQLYLLGNLIPAINDTFSTCDNLERLDLGYNMIEYIHPNAFKRLQKLKTLTLYNNKIKVLPNFQLESLQALHLYNNLIEYVPQSVFRNNVSLRWIFLNNNSISFLPQNFVSELNKAGASIESFRFYDNPWHCPCLLEQFADLKRAGVDDYELFFSLKYDGKRPACVFFGRHGCHRHPPSSLLP